MKLSMMQFTILFLLFVASKACAEDAVKKETEEKQDDGMIEKLKSSLQMAGKFLGLDAASGVAQLVSNAFNQGSRDGDKDDSSGIFARVLRILSFDMTKIGAVVVNTIIFLAQVITTSLVSKNPALPDAVVTPRKVRDGSPIDWVLENRSEKLRHLITAAKDENLTDKIIDTIKEHSGDQNTACVQQLICRIGPIIKGMQKALEDKEIDPKKNDEDVKGGKVHTRALFRYLPEFKEFNEHGDYCKRRHEECRLLD